MTQNDLSIIFIYLNIKTELHNACTIFLYVKFKNYFCVELQNILLLNMVSLPVSP